METPQDPLPEVLEESARSPEERPAVPDLAPAAAADAPSAPPVAAPPAPPVAGAPAATTPPPGAPPPQAWAAPAEVAGPAPGYAFGGAGERLVAYIVDSLIIAGLLIVVFIAGLLIAVIVPLAGLLVWLIGGLAVGIGYFPYFWVKGGQTPGLKMFQMRVVRDHDGGPIGIGSALLRLFGLYVLDGLVFYIGFIWIFIDKRNRCWHDLIAGTVVVKRA